MWLSAIDENVDKFGIFVDFADHQFQKIGEVGFVFLFAEKFTIADKALLTHF